MDLNSFEDNKIPTSQYTGRGLAIASLVLGIMGFILFCTGILPLILGAAGTILGVASIIVANKNRAQLGLHIVGTVVSAICLIIGIFITKFIKQNIVNPFEESVIEFKNMNDSMSKMLDSLEKINNDTTFLPTNFDYDVNQDTIIDDMGEAPK